jgi:hypothetical protein
LALPRHFQLGLAAVLIAVVGLTVLLVAVEGNHRPPDTIAEGDAWLDELRTPKRILVAELKGRATSGSHSLEGWQIVTQREITPKDLEGKALATLFKKGRIQAARKRMTKCEKFEATLGLEFIAPQWRRVALFDLGCEQVQGDSGIREFDPDALRAWALTVFPEAKSFEPPPAPPDDEAK